MPLSRNAAPRNYNGWKVPEGASAGISTSHSCSGEFVVASGNVTVKFTQGCEPKAEPYKQ